MRPPWKLPRACMAASLMIRMGLPRDFSKLKRVHPGPRCLGSLMMRPLRTGAGNPIETASKLQSCTSGFIWATISRGVRSGPDLNFCFSQREIINFTFEPPTSMARIFSFTP